MTSALPYLDEAAREAEWLLSDDSPTLQIPEPLAAALEKETARFVRSDQDRATAILTIGGLLDVWEAEYNGDRETFYDVMSDYLRKRIGRWAGVSPTSLRRWVRMVRRIDGVDFAKYRQTLPIEFFFAAGEMVNDSQNRYTCRNVIEPLDWALARDTDGNAPTVVQMRDAFLKDEHKPDPWNTVRDRVRGLRGELDKLPDNARREISKPYQELLAAVERLERGER